MQAAPAPFEPSSRHAWAHLPRRALRVPKTRHYGLSDCGPCRAKNEDAFLADAPLGLFIVCDGVGGRASGEVAAGEAIAIIREHIHGAMLSGATDHTRALPPRTGPHELDGGARPAPDSIAHIGAVVCSAMQRASREIFDLGLEEPGLAGMSTTASVTLVVEGYAVTGQVGDTRVYHARGPANRQITEDHTLLNLRIKQGLLDLERARGRKSPITRALGLRDAVEVDIHVTRLIAGDRLLLCTDGLHEHLQGDVLLTHLFAMDPRDAAQAAIRHASRCGGKDNATALFVEILGDDGARPR